MTDSAGCIYIHLYNTHKCTHACTRTYTNSQRKDMEATNLKVKGIGGVEERIAGRNWREKREERKLSNSIAN